MSLQLIVSLILDINDVAFPLMCFCRAHYLPVPQLSSELNESVLWFQFSRAVVNWRSFSVISTEKTVFEGRSFSDFHFVKIIIWNIFVMSRWYLWTTRNGLALNKYLLHLLGQLERGGRIFFKFLLYCEEKLIEKTFLCSEDWIC